MSRSFVRRSLVSRKDLLRIPAFLVGLLLLPSVASPGAGLSEPEYELFIACPGPDFDFSVLTDCPVYIEDSDDILGSPSLAVDWRRPSNMIIASLHGGDGDGPTNRSRTEGLGGPQLLTIFPSTTYYEDWDDCPWLPPDDIRLEGTLSEHPQVVTDALGRYYVGGLYSLEDSASPTGYTSEIWAQKYKSIGQSLSVGCNSQEGIDYRGNFNAAQLLPFFTGNTIDQFWFLFDNATQTMTIVWGEHPPRGTARLVGTGAPASFDTVSTLRDGPALPGVGPEVRSVIGTVWTTPDLEDDYYYTDESQLIGPCSSTTNPVLAAGKIYIGCVVDPTEAPYPWDKEAVRGQVDLFRFAPRGGDPEYLGTIPIDPGGEVRLGVRNDDRIAVLATYLDGGQLRVSAVFGQGSVLKDMRWSATRQFGSDIAALVPKRPVLAVTIQDLIYREPSGVVHLILKFRFQPAMIDQGVLPVPLPGEPPVSNPALVTYAKFLIAIDEHHGILKTFNLNIGNPLNRSSFASVQPPGQDAQERDDVFDDLTDDLYQLPPKAGYMWGERKLPDTYQREFYAVADYGEIQFAEIIEITDIEYEAAGLIVPTLAVPSAALSVAGIAAGVGGTVLVGLFALRAALRRSTVAAAAQQK